MRQGFKFSEAFPARWLYADELKGKEWTLTIAEAYAEETYNPGSHKPEVSHIVGFAETKKEYILNVTNGRVLVALWGDESKDWIGHRITLKPVPDDSGKGRSGLRIIFCGTPDITEPVKVKVGGREDERRIRPTGTAKGPTAPAGPSTSQEEAF